MSKGGGGVKSHLKYQRGGGVPGDPELECLNTTLMPLLISYTP